MKKTMLCDEAFRQSQKHLFFVGLATPALHRGGGWVQPKKKKVMTQGGAGCEPILSALCLLHLRHIRQPCIA